MCNVVRVELLVTLLTASLAVPSAAADEISVNQSRPMMALAGELAQRYGYLVTYEEAPVDAVREVIKEPRRNGLEFRYPAWSPVTFHLEARETSAGVPITQEPMRAGFGGTVTVSGSGSVRPLTQESVDSLVSEYNASGNPGKFTVIYDGGYAHIVPAGRSVNGQITDFQPILSTIVPAKLQEGTCWDLFSGLIGEIQTIRHVAIEVGEAPVNPLSEASCTISGHDLDARHVLIQLLDEIGDLPSVGIKDRFVWTLAHDPTEGAYWLSTRVMPGRRAKASQGHGDAATPKPGVVGAAPSRRDPLTVPAPPPQNKQ